MNVLLVTDLDNTLVGVDSATIALNQVIQAAGDRLTLIYATGRSYASARHLQAEKALLEPHYWVTGVGTEIYQQNQLDHAWAAHLSQGWDRPAIEKMAKSYRDLIPQNPSEQNPYKLSFLLPADRAAEVLTPLQAELHQAGLSAKVIYSSGEDVDILPAQADKGLAIGYLQQRLQIPIDRTLVCGDSGNDIGLFAQQTLGVIVGNAQPELLEWHRQHPHPQRYLAQSVCAWGILEAIAYFKLL